jgi:hypothetical protein
MKKKILALCFASIFFTGLCFAQNTQNGVTFKKFKTKYHQYIEAKIFDNLDPDGTEVFNDASEVAITSGSLNTAEYNEDMTVQISCPTLGSDAVDVSVYGQFSLKDDTAEGWSLLFTESITTHTTSLTLTEIAIAEEPLHTRVGVKSTGTDGTDDVTVIFLGRGRAK